MIYTSTLTLAHVLLTPSYRTLPQFPMNSSPDLLIMLLLSLFIAVISGKVRMGVMKIMASTIWKVLTALRAFQTPENKNAPVINAPSDGTAQLGFENLAAIPAKPRDRRNSGGIYPCGPMEASSGGRPDQSGQNGALYQGPPTPLPFPLKHTADCLPDYLGTASAVISQPSKKETPSGRLHEEVIPLDRKQSSVALPEASSPSVTTKHDDAEVGADVGGETVGIDIVIGTAVDAETPSKKMDIKLLPSQTSATHLNITAPSTAATTLVVPPSFVAAESETTGADKVTEGYSEYGYTDDYRYNEYGTPPTSTAQVEAAGTQAAGNSGVGSGRADFDRILGTGSPSADEGPNISARPQKKVSLKQKLKSLFGLRSPSGSNHRTNEPSSGSGGNSTFMWFKSKLQRVARRAGTRQELSRNRASNRVQFASMEGVRHTFDALLTLLTCQTLNCTVDYRLKKRRGVYKLRAEFRQMRQGRLTVVIASLVVGEKEVEGVEGRTHMQTVITIQPSKRDKTIYPNHARNNYTDFVDTVMMGLTEVGILLPEQSSHSSCDWTLA